MVGLMLLSTVLQQADKLVVTNFKMLEEFGYYTIAFALAQAPVSLSSPIAAAVYPRLTGLVSLGEREKLSQLYHRTCRIVTVFAITGGLTLALFSGQFIFAWTGSTVIAHRAAVVCSLLLFAQVLQAMTSVPYNLALAQGKVGLNIKIGIASVVIFIPLLIILVPRFGIVGAGVSWLIFNIVTFPPYIYFLHRRFLPGETGRWLVQDIGIPLLAAVPCIFVGRWLISSVTSRIASLCLIALVWVVSAAVSALTVSELRKVIFEKLSRLAGATNEP
jgi:O-antigen/teichoic acid export membrane protein